MWRYRADFRVGAEPRPPPRFWGAVRDRHYSPMTIARLDSRPPIKSFALRLTKHFVPMMRSRIPGPHQQLDAHFELCCTLPADADGGPALYTELETVPV
jgi:hypothetical protein